MDELMSDIFIMEAIFKVYEINRLVNFKIKYYCVKCLCLYLKVIVCIIYSYYYYLIHIHIVIIIIFIYLSFLYNI